MTHSILLIKLCITSRNCYNTILTEYNQKSIKSEIVTTEEIIQANC